MAGAAAAREAMLTTRTPKVEIDGDALTARWCDEAVPVDDVGELVEGGEQRVVGRGVVGHCPRQDSNWLGSSSLTWKS